MVIVNYFVEYLNIADTHTQTPAPPTTLGERGKGKKQVKVKGHEGDLRLRCGEVSTFELGGGTSGTLACGLTCACAGLETHSSIMIRLG